MIIENLEQVTQAVLDEMKRTPDARTKEILESMVRHLHGFVREVKLTEKEFDKAINYVAALGQLTTASHNEVRLMAGYAGCLHPGLPDEQRPERGHRKLRQSPRPVLENGFAENGERRIAPAVRDPGPALFFKGWVRDQEGRPIAGAEVDVWHASPVGLYENQDPDQAEMNLRGKFTTDANGEFSFRSIKPSGYPIPTNGPVGALSNAQKRHNFRPAHLHFLIYKPGFKTVTSQIYSPDDPHLETDSQFGVTRALVGAL